MVETRALFHFVGKRPSSNKFLNLYMKSSFAETDKRHLGVRLNTPPCESGVYRFLQNSVSFSR